MSSYAHVNGIGISDPNQSQIRDPSLNASREYMPGMPAPLMFPLSGNTLAGDDHIPNEATWMSEVRLRKLASSETDSLRFLTDQSLISRGPLVFVLVLMMMVGGTVNSLVTLVFLRRFPASALRSFIVTMSVSDLVATMAGIPCYIFIILHAYSFRYPELCQVFFAVISLSTNLSSFIVTCMAVDRVRRVHNPTFKGRDKTTSYYKVAVTVLLAVLVTAPFVPLYGINTEPTFSGYRARMCWIDDRYKNTAYAQLYMVVLAGTFALTFLSTFISYFIIGYKIHVLTSNLTKELTYTLEHPLPPRKNMHIYEETPEEVPRENPELQGQKESDVCLQIPAGQAAASEEPKRHSSLGAALSFAEKLHSPKRQIPEVEVQDPNRQTKRFSKMKKISNAIHDFFQPVEISSSGASTSDSSFISIRAHGSFAKSMEKTVTTKEVSEKIFLKHPSLMTKSLIVAPRHMNFILDTEMTSSQMNVSTYTASIQPPGFLAQCLKEDAAVEPGKDAPQPDKELAPAATEDKASKVSTSTLEDRQSSKASLKQAQRQDSHKSLLVPHASLSKGKSSSGHVRLSDKDDGKGRRVSKERKESRMSNLALLEEQLRLETLATLRQLGKIKRTSRNTMLILVFFFALTWLPNLITRFLINHPPQMCQNLRDCWGNVESYAISSVFINSTLNAFFNCFSSVHFRRQVKFFFKPFKDRLCRKRRRKRVTRFIQKKPPNPPPPPLEPPIEEVEPAQEKNNCPLQPVPPPDQPKDTGNTLRTSTREGSDSSSTSSNEEKGRKSPEQKDAPAAAGTAPAAASVAAAAPAAATPVAGSSAASFKSKRA